MRYKIQYRTYLTALNTKGCWLGLGLTTTDELTRNKSGPRISQSQQLSLYLLVTYHFGYQAMESEECNKEHSLDVPLLSHQSS